MGSSGIAIKILYDEVKSWVNPYDPANKMTFGIGAMNRYKRSRSKQNVHKHIRTRNRWGISSWCDSHLEPVYIGR